MYVPAAAESALWALVRLGIRRGGPDQRIAEAAADVLRPPPPPLAHGSAQRVFWGVDADGLPVRPWRVDPADIVQCVALHGDVPAHICVARQVASDAQRTTDLERGQASDYPHCVTARCAQGRGIREALDPTCRPTWRGAGPNGRFDRGRHDAPEQREAYQRKAAVGLVDAVPSIDEEPPEEGE
jgi:hypothetical protein